MSLAQKTMDQAAGWSETASARLHSARMRDIAFAIKRAAGDRRLDDQDLHMLTEIVFQATQRSISLTRDYLVAELVRRNRSAHKAADLADAVFR